jgi:superfamily II DNA or RNA helicase
LSATVARKDGHHPIIFMQCGPVRHRVNARAQAAARPFEHFVFVQPTAFQPKRSPDSDKRVEFQALYQGLIDDELRTRRICDDVIAAACDGRSPLVLTERNDHLDRLEQALGTSVRHVVVLRAGMGKKQRQAVTDRLAAIPRDEGRVLLATGKYVGEGFDDPRLDTLFLTLPVSWRGTIAQYSGRLHAARTVPADAEGAGRARSATEAFFHRRLETLAETKGRFRLNVALPIAFDGVGTLEVDLLCVDARVAVELDGSQHLAEDVGRDLDLVLDAILRALSNRQARLSPTSPLHFVRQE